MHTHVHFYYPNMYMHVHALINWAVLSSHEGGLNTSASFLGNKAVPWHQALVGYATGIQQMQVQKDIQANIQDDDEIHR